MESKLHDIQSPRFHTHFYEFPEFPYPEEYQLADNDLPDGQLIYDYCCAYVEKFSLREKIQFESRFMRLETPDAADRDVGWWVVYKDAKQSEHREAFQFVIVATGVNAIPAMPEEYKDLEKFEGVLLPARYADDQSLVANKRVLVIGGNKTAMSVAEACEKLGAQTTLLFRRAHWPIPEYTLGFIPVHQWFMRLSKIALPGYYTQRGLMQALQWMLAPLKKLIWLFLQWAFCTTLGLFGDLLPSIGPLDDVYICGTYIATRGLFDKMKQGRIKPVKGDVDRFTKDGVILQDGRHLSGFDVILTALGYHRDYSFLPPEWHRLLDIEEDGLWLYRHIIPTKVPGLAFVGGEMVTNDGILSLGIQAEWIARVIAGKIVLPTVEDQLGDVAAMKEWKRSWMLPSTRRSQMIMQHDSYYRDQLIRDTGYSIYMHGLTLRKILLEFLYPPESCIWKRFFLLAEEETSGKRPVPKTSFYTVKPLKQQLPQPTEIKVKSGGKPVLELMEKGIIKHPLTKVGMPVLQTVRGVKYGTAVRKSASVVERDLNDIRDKYVGHEE
eukprot:jgi/Botrbrau1/23382/Bobra.0051s0032.3